MKGMKRFIAALLVALIMVASVPAVRTEAAGRAISAKFIDWGRRTITVDGESMTTYDASTCFVGVKKCNATQFYYEVYDSNGTKQLRKGYAYQAKDPNNLYPDYQVFKVPGTRRTVVCSVRVRAKIDGKWSAYSGWISLVPPHTPDYIRHDASNWTAVKRTVGDHCTVEKFRGSKLQSWKKYYYKVVGRKYFKGKYILEKGNTDANCRSFVIAEIEWQ